MDKLNLSGQNIDKYTIKDYITEGAHSFIYLAQQPVLGREVAIKIPLFRFETQGTRVSRTTSRSLLDEAKILSLLEHPNVIPIHDAGEGQLWVKGTLLENIPFYTMRYASGGNLADRVAEDGLPVMEVVEVAAALADAIDYMHRKDILHRDLKPRDILFDEFNIPYIGNFGMAVLHTPVDPSQGDDVRHVGTMEVVAPEIWHGAANSRASDIYAFGCTIYHALAGRFPFEAPAYLNSIEDPSARHDAYAAALSDAHCHAAVPTLSSINPDFGPLLDGVFERVLAKDPAVRFRTAREFSVALNEAYRYEGKSRNIFVSYSRTSSDRVQELVRRLRAMGHNPWFDGELSQRGGRNWWDLILENIRSCDVVLFVMTESSVESRPCLAEVTYAEQLGKPIIPIIIDDAFDGYKAPKNIATIQWIYLTTPSGETNLRQSLAGLPHPTPDLPDPLPPPPPVPMTELQKLRQQIDENPASKEEQLLIVGSLGSLLNNSAEHDGALELLLRFKASNVLRQDVLPLLNVVVAGASDSLTDTH